MSFWAKIEKKLTQSLEFEEKESVKGWYFAACKVQIKLYDNIHSFLVVEKQNTSLNCLSRAAEADLMI